MNKSELLEKALEMGLLANEDMTKSEIAKLIEDVENSTQVESSTPPPPPTKVAPTGKSNSPEVKKVEKTYTANQIRNMSHQAVSKK